MSASKAIAAWKIGIKPSTAACTCSLLMTTPRSAGLDSTGAAEELFVGSACSLSRSEAAATVISNVKQLPLLGGRDQRGTFASAGFFHHFNTSSSRTRQRSSSALHTSTGTSSSSSSNSRKAADEPALPSGDATHPWYNVPNALSIGRGLSGPVIGYWIMQDQWTLAVSALVISGATDWLDGYVARRFNQRSIVGSYLDPLGDKVLIGSVAAALTLKGIVPLWVAGVILGRDVGLVAGMFILRASSFGWKWPGAEAFFKTSTGPGTFVPGAAGAADQLQQQATTDTTDSASAQSAAIDSSTTGGVPFMQPLMISKANTVLQLVLVAAYILRAQAGWPDAGMVSALEITTVATTIISSAAYARQLMTGRVIGAARS